MANTDAPTQDAVVDPEVTRKLADVYSQNGPQAPTFAPPSFLRDAIGAMQSYGAPQSPDAVDRNTPPPAPPAPSQVTLPPGFNPRAAPPDQRGAGPGPDISGALAAARNFANMPLPGQSIARTALSGIMAPASLQSVGINPPPPQYEDTSGIGGLQPQPQQTAESAAAQRGYRTANAALGTVAGVFQPEAGSAGEAAKALGESGGLAKRIGGEAGAIGVGAGADTGAAQQAAKAALGGEVYQRQLAALKAGGATDEQIAEFAKTMAPPPDRVGTVTTAEGGVASAKNLTNALQTAAGTEGVPLSQHPVFARYSSKGEMGPAVARAHGGDIGTATRAVLAADPDAIKLLGPDLTQQLLENKIADIIRKAPVFKGGGTVSEQTVRDGLGILAQRGGAAAADASAQEVVAAGTNYANAVEAVTGVKPGFLQTAEDKVAAAHPSDIHSSFDAMVGDAGTPGGGKTPEGPRLTTMGGPNQPVRLPEGPPDAKSAGAVAQDMLGEVLNLPRIFKAGADVSALGLQGAPMIVSDLVATPMTLLSMARGSAQRPYAIPAIAKMGMALFSGPGRMTEVTQGFRDSLVAAGLRPGRDVFIADPLGGIGAREEHMLGNLATEVPMLGLLYRQGNFAYATLLNALRTGEALNLRAAYKEAGLPFNASKVGHFANIATGRGDLPFQNTELSQRVADAMSGVFFGPRLLTSSWQNAVDNIAAIRSLAGDIGRRPLDPTDLARIRTTVSFVAAGYGAMKLAEASGLAIGTDPTGTDFGRITLPDGRRLDLWGPFNENARLVAREWLALSNNLQGKPAPYGSNPGIDPLLNYFRSKLNPPAGAAYDLLKGKTPAGLAFNTAYNPFDEKNAPARDILQNPLSPVPMGLSQILSSLNVDYPGRAAPSIDAGPGLGAAETAANVAGFTVIDSPAHIIYDGLGRPQSDPRYNNDPVLAEFARLATNPDFSKTGVMDPPRPTIGTGSAAIKLPATESNNYVQQVGEARRVALSSLIYSQQYQDAARAQQEKMWKDAVDKANNDATRQYLATSVIAATDPKTIAAEALNGFTAQPSAKDQAYWVALLDRAGKLTPDARAAINGAKVTLPGERAPLTVDEMVRAAPLVHEYLSHAPYGTDARPFGTPQDWAAADQARTAMNNRRDELVRGGVNPNIAPQQAMLETMRTLSPVQQQILRNGALLENPARRVMAQRYGTMLTRFLGPKPNTYQESDAAYRNFPSQ